MRLLSEFMCVCWRLCLQWIHVRLLIEFTCVCWRLCSQSCEWTLKFIWVFWVNLCASVDDSVHKKLNKLSNSYASVEWIHLHLLTTLFTVNSQASVDDSAHNFVNELSNSYASVEWIQMGLLTKTKLCSQSCEWIRTFTCVCWRLCSQSCIHFEIDQNQKNTFPFDKWPQHTHYHKRRWRVCLFWYWVCLFWSFVCQYLPIWQVTSTLWCLWRFVWNSARVCRRLCSAKCLPIPILL